ncbi:unnamed protein product [Zymoseptoria tritici ST99CH_3D7]|uniref:GPR1/FUN34/YaaH-class plasma membrane protein n=1 Tax=Zymoseptoria tritici (strain ST99CH_3D7) TaxID=1276538 RepID=A0A1X7S3Z7_ZYMT9|nr:unnamed protein product [Zymoseptoria tritici ST99CH_3D7]
MSTGTHDAVKGDLENNGHYPRENEYRQEDYAFKTNSNGGSNGYGLTQAPTNVTISNEQFERLYLSPRNARQEGHLRNTFANPTPVAVMGFSVALTPIAAALMGWRGSGGAGAANATNTASIWFGGMLLIIAGLLEFVLGNTFPFVVFMGYGSHFLVFATSFIPWYNSVSAYTTGNPYETGSQEQTPAFAASYGFYPLSLCILSFIFLICSFRTNAVFVLIFIAATIGFGCAAGAFFQLAQGNTVLGTNLLVGAGGAFWGAAMFGWYLLAALMFQIMELPIPLLPVFDLSEVIKAKKPKSKAA